MAMQTTNIIAVPISTVNMTGFLNINFGFSLTKDCTSASFTCLLSNNELDLLLFISINYFSVKYSANGPSARAGKNDKAAMIAITAKTIIPNIEVSVFNVPALSGMYFLLASSPAIASGPMIGKKRDSSKTIPVVMFQNGLLSPSPSNPLPLLAALDVYSYNISENP